MKNKISQEQLKDLAEFANRLDETGRRGLEKDLSGMTDAKRNEAIAKISSMVNSTGTITKAPGKMEQIGRTIQREVLSPIAQGLNLAAFGLPEAAMRKMAPEIAREVFQQPRSVPGVLLQGGAQLTGLLAGGPGVLGRGLAKAAVPARASGLGLGAAQSTPGAIASFQRAKGLKDIGRAAIEGGVIGGAVLTEPRGNLGQQAQQQAYQATVGAMSGAAFSGLSKTASGIKRNLLKQVPIEKRNSLFSYVKPNVSLSKRIGRLKSDNQAERTRAIQEIDEIVGGLEENVENQLKVLNARIRNKTLDDALQVQKDLLNMNKQLTKAYGSTLDDITKYADDSGVQPLLSDVDDMFMRTIYEMEDAGLDSERVYKLAKNLHKKYQIVPEDELMGVKSLDELINQVFDPNTKIPFKDLQNDIKQITKIRSAGQRAGTADAATTILRKNYMDMLMQADDVLVKRFGDLQNSYSKSVEVIKEGFKVFKPRKGELGTKQGVNLIERAAKEEGQERALLKSLEESKKVGDVVIPGIRPILKGAMETAKQVNSIKRVSANVVKNEKLKQSIVKRKLEQRDRMLEARRRIAEDIEGMPQGIERLKRVAENAVIGASAAAGVGAAIKIGTGKAD